ncbi:MAG: hypothetical protein AABY22_31840 [Nanoarchaeota archaeon]
MCCNKRKIVKSWKEMKEEIDKYNGKTNVFTSLYSFKKTQTKTTNEYSNELGDYTTANVDKLFFDFANDNCYNNIIAMHNYLLNLNLKHCINCSGRKYHVYVFVKNSDKCLFLKDACYNAQVDICKKLNLTYGQENHNTPNNPDIDSKLMGNLAGLTRLPNTWNPTAKRFCIRLTKDWLLRGHEAILKLAQEQQYEWEVFGKECLNLLDYDRRRIDVFNEETNFGLDIPLLMGEQEIGEEKFYPCVYKMITDGGYGNLFNVALWLRDKGYTYKEADLIFKKYLKGKFRRTPGYGDDYEHSHRHDKNLETAYGDNEGRYLFPTCSVIWQEGNCPGKCKAYNKHYWNRKKREEKQIIEK